MHAVRLVQSAFVGTMILTFKDEGKARLVTEAVREGAAAPHTTAEYLGRVNETRLTFAATQGADALSLRQQAKERFEAAMPHRIAYDVLDLKPGADEPEWTCDVLAGWRAKTEG